MGKEIIECNHGALARVCDRCEAENEKYRLAAEIERLQAEVEHWKSARDAALEGGDILKAEIEALKAELHLAKSLRKEER
jgi:uncharacterized small protein (DUF1192 family)